MQIKSLGIFFGMFVLITIKTFVLFTFWDWFIVPIFYVASITFPQALGLLVTIETIAFFMGVGGVIKIVDRNFVDMMEDTATLIGMWLIGLGISLFL